jgi:hypothetical protein
MQLLGDNDIMLGTGMYKTGETNSCIQMLLGKGTDGVVGVPWQADSIPDGR